MGVIPKCEYLVKFSLDEHFIKPLSTYWYLHSLDKFIDDIIMLTKINAQNVTVDL